MVGEPYNSNEGPKFHWIEINASGVKVPDEWYDLKTSICLKNMLTSENWYCEPVTSLNPEKMLEGIKEELIYLHKKTEKWQHSAIKHSLPCR